MCPPIIAVAAIVSTAVAVGGQVAAGKARAKGQEAQAEQDVKNSQYAHMAELDAIRQGGVDAARARGEGTKVIAAQRVAFGASGVDVSSKSAVDTYAETREMSEMDAAIIEVQAARDAWGFKTKGLNYQKQAVVNREAADQTRTGTFLTATGTAIQGLGAAAGAFKGS
jgi:hypothetical protein